MPKRQFPRGLEAESQFWVRQGVVSPEQREKIKALYSPSPDASLWPQNLVAALAALLVGIGVIVLISYNWEYFPKLVKLLVAILPLPASAGFLWYWGGVKGSRISTDIGVILNGLSIFLALALVSQVYQLQGSLFLYLVSALLLWAPVVLWGRSLGGGLLFTFLAGVAFFFESWREPLGTWALLLFLIPATMGWLKFQLDKKPLKSLVWTGALAFFFASLFSQGAWLGDTLWVVFLSLWAGLWSSLGLLLESSAPGESTERNRPLTLLGQILTFLLLGLFSLTFFWEEILPSSFSRFGELVENSPTLWWVLGALVLVSAMAGSIYRMIKEKTWNPFPLFPGFILILGSVLLHLSSPDRGLWGSLIVSLLTAVQAVFWILDKEKRSFRVIGGALLILAVVNLRFFDGDVPILVKGTVFVLSGAAFWQLYLWKFKKVPAKTSDTLKDLNQDSNEGEK